LLLPQLLALQTSQISGDVASNTKILHGCAVGRLGDDRRRPC
jgi:hypothetical protein